MPGRKRGTPPLLETGGEFDASLKSEMQDWMQGIDDGMAGLQGTPETPSTVQAGVAADATDSQSPAPSTHIHAIQTAAPSVPVALGGAAAEGVGLALMRADATLVLDDGGASQNDQLQWDGTAWVPSDDAEILNWLNL